MPPKPPNPNKKKKKLTASSSFSPQQSANVSKAGIMALTITSNLTEVADADSSTNWETENLAAGHGLDTDQNWEGTNCYAGKLQSTGSPARIYYNNGSGIDFSSELLRIWYRVTELTKYDTVENGGIAVYVEDTSGNWGEWTLGGVDSSISYAWTNAVVDTSLPFDRTSATSPTMTAIQKMGMSVRMLTKPTKADNLFVDVIRYGDSLTVTGTNTTTGVGWQEIADYDNDKFRRYGVLVPLADGGFALKGKIIFGDSGATASTDFTDTTSAKIILPENTLISTDATDKRLGGSSLAGQGIEIVGNGTGTTDFELGSVVGSGDSRQGLLGTSFISEADKFDFDSETDTSDIDSCNLYGVTFQNAGLIEMAGASTQDSIGCTYVNCDEIRPNTTEFLNNTIIAPAPDRGLEMVASHAIKQIDFIAGGSGDLNPTVWQNDDSLGIYVNFTEDFIDAGTGDVLIVPASAVTNDAGYFGFPSEFTEIEIDVGTARSGGTAVWEYYNGSTWSSLPGLTDNTNTLSTTGVNTVTWDRPSDWTKTSIYRETPVFYIRYRITANVTTSPILDEGTITSIHEHGLHIPSAGTYSSSGLNFFGYPSAPPAVAPKYHVENSTNATVADSYADTNQNGEHTVYGTSSGQWGQSFTGNGGVLSRSRFDLRINAGSPTGNVVSKLYASTGTHGTNAVPTGAALATSEPIDVTTLPSTLTVTDFEFKDEVTLTNGTIYVITLEYTGGDISNRLGLGYDNSAPTHAGNRSVYNGSSWQSSSVEDLIFYVHTGGIVKLNLSSSNASTYENTGSPQGATIINNLTSVTLTGLVANTEVRVYETGTTNEIDGVENSGTSFTFQADATQNVDIVIHHINYVHRRIKNYDVPNSDVSIPIQQRFDRNYSNP